MSYQVATVCLPTCLSDKCIATDEHTTVALKRLVEVMMSEFPDEASTAATDPPGCVPGPSSRLFDVLQVVTSIDMSRLAASFASIVRTPQTQCVE